MKNSEIWIENGISELKFSKNGVYCAVAAKKNARVYIYEVKTLNDVDSWVQLQQMKEHTQTVSSLDWAEDEKIITASHDRSVFVWRKNGAKWDKMLVNIDVKLSVMVCQWAPNQKKFALGSCPSTITLGFYNSEAQCWTAIVKEKFVKAPVTSLDFHPSSNVMAVGSVDGSVKLISCSLRNSKDPNIVLSKVDDQQYSGVFEKVDSCWETLHSVDSISPRANSWINHVSFECNGSRLVVLPHSSHIKVFDVRDDQILANEQDIAHPGLPFMKGFINSEKQELVVAGFDKKVAVFSKAGDCFKFSSFLSKNEKSNKSFSKGIVEKMMKGIEKKQFSLGEPPKPDEHYNTTKVTCTRRTYVSFDVSGVVHFWQ